MKNTHVNDENIQRFAFDQSECAPAIINHIQTCEECKKRVETYLLFSTAIKDQPEPILAYNLSALVVDQLTSSKEVKSNYDYILYFIIIASVGWSVSTLYIFRDTLLYLFRNSLISENYFIISIAVFISVVLGLDIVRSFNKKINVLDS